MTRSRRWPAWPAKIALLLLASASPLHAAEGGDLPRILNFVVVAAVLFLAVRKPLAGYLQARTDQIRSELADAKEKSARAKEELRKAEALLASLDDEVEKAKREAKEAAEKEAARILQAAEVEAERIKAIAFKEIDNEVEAGRRQLLARAAELSVSLAQKKLESSMTREDQIKLIDRSIDRLEKTRS